MNLRARLLELEFKTSMPDNSVVLRFLGSCLNDGTKLSPENVIYILHSAEKLSREIIFN